MSSRHNRQYWPAQEAQARALSTALGQGWIARNASPNPDEYQAWHLQRLEDGLELDLQWDDQGQREDRAKRGEAVRLAVRGVWPRDHEQQACVPTQTERGGHRTSITVDAGKPAEAIAKEIQRRLLAGFTLLHRRAMDIVNRRGTYHTQIEQTLRTILEAIPGSYRGQHAKASVYFRSENHAYSVSVQGESVRFEAFSCPAAVAIRVLQACQEQESQGAEDNPDLEGGFNTSEERAEIDRIFAAHQVEDPHCTCPDCIEAHQAQVRE